MSSNECPFTPSVSSIDHTDDMTPESANPPPSLTRTPTAYGSVPTPDPTRLTTEAMARLVAERGVLVDAQLAIRDASIQAVEHGSKARAALIEALISGVEAKLAERLAGAMLQLRERLDAMDKANEVLSANVNRVPTDLQTAMETVGRYNDVKFSAISDALQVLRAELSNRFELLDRQTVREKAAADLAVLQAFAAADKAAAAATAASSEAIRKSEAATAETIKTNEQARIAGNTALTDKIDDDRERMNRIEQSVNAISTQRATQADTRVDNRATQNLGLVAISVVLALITTVAIIYGLTAR